MDVLTNDLSLLETIYQFEDTTVDLYSNLTSARYNAYIAEDSSILMEGFSDMCKTIGNAIKKLIEGIKNFFLGFIRAITSYNMSLKEFVTKYKNELLKADCDFEIDGYNFTVLDAKTPDMSDFNKLVATYNSSLSDIEKTTKGEITNEGNAFLSDKNLDEIRARVLGVNGGILKDEFVETVRKHYRGGKSETSTIHIDSSQVKEIVNNVDKIVDGKKKAVKDRDDIINLLSKAEVFFNRKVDVVYRNAEQKIGAKTFDVDDEKKTVSYGDTDINYSESAITKISALVTTKYNETKAVSGIINVVVSERANAFKDLVKQDRKIVGMALSSPKKKKSEDVDEATNYSDYGDQVSYVLHESEIAACKKAIESEFNFLIESIESGEIQSSVMEASVRDAGKAVKDTVIAVIQNIMHQYRQKAIGQIQQYSAWYSNQDVVNNCTSNAENKNLTLVPLWDGKYGATTMSQIQRLFTAAVRKTSDPNRCPWAKQFVTADTIEDLRSMQDLNNRLKNYFRVGKKDLSEAQPVQISGKRLSGVVIKMFDYLENYDTISKGSDTLGNSAKALKAPVAESFDADLFIGILGKPLCESDFFVYEADAPGGIGGNAGLGDGAKAAATTRAQAPNQTAQNAGKEASQSATKVVDNTKEDAKKATGTNDKKDSGNTSMANYYKTSIDFCKRVALAYVTALEERFLLFYRTCEACASDEFKPKKFLDKSGNQKETNQNVAEPKENK